MKMMMISDMSVLVNNPHQVVLIAPPTSRRVIAFQHSLQKIRWPQAQVITYGEAINKPEKLINAIRPQTIVRIETSGECAETERLLLNLGKATTPQSSLQNSEDLQLEKGEIIPSIQWNEGLNFFFKHVQKVLSQSSKHYCTLDFDEGLILFDKRKTAQYWQQKGLPIPQQLIGTIENFEHLLSCLIQQNIPRVFIKLAHGSAASGTMALCFNGKAIKAISTIDMVNNQQLHFYNTRRIKQYTDIQTIEKIVNYLIKYHHLQIEAWIPKANYQGNIFDVRVVVIDGKAQHTLIRLGKQAMTNLHLENGRGNLEHIKDYLGESWASIPALAEQAMQVFPHSLYAGIDVLITQHQRKVYLLEANTFGDFHPNTYIQGLDTYQAELLALLKRNKILHD